MESSAMGRWSLMAGSIAALLAVNMIGGGCDRKPTREECQKMAIRMADLAFSGGDNALGLASAMKMAAREKIMSEDSELVRECVEKGTLARVRCVEESSTLEEAHACGGSPHGATTQIQSLGSNQCRAKQGDAKRQLRQIALALDAYQSRHSRYPKDLSDLAIGFRDASYQYSLEVAGSAYTVFAEANIDSDDTVDKWKIDSVSRNVEEILNDCKK